jgi:hypothetical protein
MRLITSLTFTILAASLMASCGAPQVDVAAEISAASARGHPGTRIANRHQKHVDHRPLITNIGSGPTMGGRLHMTDNISRYELCEAHGCADIFGTVAHIEDNAAGIRVEKVGGAILGMATKVDVLEANRVLAAGIHEPITSELVEEISARFHARGVSRFLFPVSPATQPAFPEQVLLPAGLTHYSNWVKLSMSTDAAPNVDCSLDVREIGPEHAEAFGRTLQEVLEWPEALRDPFARTVGQPGFRHYIAFDGSAPAATASFYVRDGIAWFHNASTREEYRGRGAQSALIARRLRDAADAGYGTAITEVAEPKPDRTAQSYRNLSRLGFDIAYLRPNYICYTNA